MALIQCPDCGRPVSTAAVSCPNCGRPIASATTGSSKPPSVARERVGDGIVWLIAFLPLITPFIVAYLASAAGTSMLDFWWITPVLIIVLCLVDQKKVRAAGYNTDGMFWRAVVFVPLYLFNRARRLKQTNSYGFVSLATYLTPLFFYIFLHR